MLRRDRIGFVFQAFNLVPTLTAEENIRLPSRAGRPPARSGWLETLVDSARDRRPAAASPVRAVRRSAAAGRRRPGRMVTRPELIFADEPTGQLGLQVGAEVLGMTRAAVDELGQTVVMVTHDARAASYADRVVFLADGRIVDELARPDRWAASSTRSSNSGSVSHVRLALKSDAGQEAAAVQHRAVGDARRRVPGRHARVHRHDAGARSTTCSPTSTPRPIPTCGRRSIAGARLRCRRNRGRMPDELAGRDRQASPASPTPRASSQGYAQIVGADGDAHRRSRANGAPTLGMSYVGGELSPWQLTAGSTPPGPGEVVIDKGERRQGRPARSATGDRAHPDRAARVLPRRHGTVRDGRLTRRSQRRAASISTTAQQLLLGGRGRGRRRSWSTPRPGVDETTLTARISAPFCRRHRGAHRLRRSPRRRSRRCTRRSASSTRSCSCSPSIGLVVACFTIYNTFQIIVTQRTREMALLRSVGATRARCCGRSSSRRVLVGLVASAVGLAAGVGVARVL